MKGRVEGNAIIWRGAIATILLLSLLLLLLLLLLLQYIAIHN